MGQVLSAMYVINRVKCETQRHQQHTYGVLCPCIVQGHFQIGREFEKVSRRGNRSEIWEGAGGGGALVTHIESTLDLVVANVPLGSCSAFVFKLLSWNICVMFLHLLVVKQNVKVHRTSCLFSFFLYIYMVIQIPGIIY